MIRFFIILLFFAISCYSKVTTDSLKAVTGTFSGTVNVDSLNSNKGITTTGRFVGTDLQATDTVKGVSGTFSGTVSGDSTVTNGSRIIGDLKFSGIGSLSTGNYLSLTGALSTGRLSSGSTNSLNSISTYLDSKALELSVGSTSGFVSGILLGARSYTGTDPDAITFWTRSTKRATIDGPTGSLTLTGALSSTTLNTGNGANELYPMNQAVTTTSDVEFDSSKTRISVSDNVNTGTLVALKSTSVTDPYIMVQSKTTGSPYSMYAYAEGNSDFGTLRMKIGSPHSGDKDSVIVINGETGAVGFSDSIKIGTGSYLKTYVEGTMPCTLKTSDVTVQQIGTGYYTKTGNIVTLQFPLLQGTSNSSNLRVYFALPYNIKNTYATGIASYCIDNGVTGTIKYVTIANGQTYAQLGGNATWTSSGNKGFYPFPVTYIAE